MTALEIDSRLAHSLAARLGGTNVRVVHGDATAMPFEDATFTGALACTMLHHVPSPSLQDQLFREVMRVLKPGAVFAGMDGRQSFRMKVLHIYDTLVPIDPDGLGARLEAAGFDNISIEANPTSFRFRARRRSVNS
jgi:SAM-dependent methyltransferase